MTKPNIKIVNAETGEELERQMNATEFAQYESDKAADKVRLDEAQTKATAKAELLERLGITADEAKLLLA